MHCLQITGKYPHLLINTTNKKGKQKNSNEAEINFGSVPVGKMAEKWVEIHNLSPVIMH